MEQWIPVLREPLDQRENVPVYGVDSLALGNVSAEIATLYPDLETAPREADVGIDALSVIGIGSERDLYGELAGVAGQPLPLGRHELVSVPIPSNIRPAHQPLTPPPATGTKRTSTSRLPRFAVFSTRFVTHADNDIAIVLAVLHDRSIAYACGTNSHYSSKTENRATCFHKGWVRA